MIKTLLIIFIFVLFAINSQAQNTMETVNKFKKHDITAGVGLVNDVQFLYKFNRLGGLYVPNSDWLHSIADGVFTPFVTYKYWFNKRFALGVSFLLNLDSVRVVDYIAYRNSKNYSRIQPTIAMEYVFNYVYRPIWQLYTSLGLGTTITKIHQSKLSNSIDFNMHFSPLGLRVGKDVGGFIELGFGYKGFLNAGISVRL